jgi:drug/metabolite transporter (DMT)-like permease
MHTIFYIFVSVFAVVAAQICMKTGLNHLRPLDPSSGIFALYQKILLSPFVALGVTLYALGTFSWLYVLTRVDLSYAFPFLGLTYVLVTLASCLLLGEYVSLLRWSGIIIISVGVILVSTS